MTGWAYIRTAILSLSRNRMCISILPENLDSPNLSYLKRGNGPARGVAGSCGLVGEDALIGKRKPSICVQTVTRLPPRAVQFVCFVLSCHINSGKFFLIDMAISNQTHDPHMNEARFGPRAKIMKTETSVFSRPLSPLPREGKP